MSLFELDWLGGPPERYFRRIRPGIDEMPWGTLDPSRYPTTLIDRARVSWTEAAWNEYCTGAAFAKLVGVMLEVQAPIDLIAVAADFVADEVLHVELTSRLAMELGGGAPYDVDFSTLTLPDSAGVSALQRANEQVVRLCCVGEVFSVPMLANCMKTAAHPLTRAVLERIVRDEAPHGFLGAWWFEWVEDRLDDEERARLGQVALEMIRLYAPFWAALTSRTANGITTEGYRLEHVHELGWTESVVYAREARRTMREDVLPGLARFGIHPDRVEVDALLRQGAL